MLRHALHAKLHHATVTYCDADYVGSITIDRDLLDASGMRPNEKVLVADCDSAARFETYVIPGERGSGVIGVNGACARLSQASMSPSPLSIPTAPQMSPPPPSTPSRMPTASRNGSSCACSPSSAGSC